MKNLTALSLLFTLYTAAFAQKPFDYPSDFHSIREQVLTIGGPLEYDSLLARFRKADTTMTPRQVLALMIGFTGLPAYKPYEVQKDEERINKLKMADKYTAVLAASDSFLRAYPLSIKVIYERALAFYELKQTDSADFYLTQFSMLRDAMSYSGSIFDRDGAAFALGPLDSHYFIRGLGVEVVYVEYIPDYMRYKIEKITIQDENGKKAPLYFNIQHAYMTTDDE